MDKSMRPNSGFTLLELLAVIAVIALLAGLLVPALAKAMAVSRGVGCLGNLRQWSLGTQGFADDHQGLLPSDGAGNGTSRSDAWYADIPPYLGQRPYAEQGEWRTNSRVRLPGSVWLCPGNRRTSDGRMLFHYCLNRLVNGSGAEARPIRLIEVREPARTVWLFDNGKKAAVAAAGNVHTNLHQAGANLVFLDGHVARMPRSTYWDDRRGRPRTDAPELRWAGRDPGE